MTSAAEPSNAPAPRSAAPRLQIVPSDTARITALEDEITTLAGHLAAATAAFLKLLAEFDRAGGWQAHGLRSCAQWLSWKCGMSVSAAREHVRVALALPSLPAVSAAFSDGKLSFSKVRAVTRVATPATEVELVETAQTCTASQLDRLCSGIKRVRTNEEVVTNRSQATFTSTWREDGMLSFSGRLTPEDGAALLAALAAFKADPIRQEQDPAGAEAPADALPDDQFRDVAMLAARADAEALVMLARHCLDAPPAEVLSEPVRLIIHAQESGCAVTDPPAADTAVADPVSADPAAESGASDTSAEVFGATALLDAGPAIPLLPLSPATFERLACSAIVESASDPDTDVEGKSQNRFASKRQRRALLRRDGGCRFGGCSRKRGLHAHHVVHYSNGGPTIVANLILLCDHHHLLVHEGGWRIEMTATGWVVVSPLGQKHVDAPPTLGDAAAIPTAHKAAIRATTVVGRWAGDPLDLAYVVGTFVGRGGAAPAVRNPGPAGE